MGKQKGPSKKTQKKIQQKIIQDKTFGLKNKNKSKKVQKYIKGVQQNVKFGNVSQQKLKDMEYKQKLQKQKQLQKDEMINSLYNNATNLKQNAPKQGEDSKSIVCVFFKAGWWVKGNKCKFSHDLSLQNKGAKINIYIDLRDKVKDESMDNWNGQTLQKVINAKQQKRGRAHSTLIWKHFLNALEKKSYGWFWQCPNGQNWVYRHCLPKGYILQKDKDLMKKIQKQNQVPLQDQLENQRNILLESRKTLTPVTPQTYLKWKQKQKKQMQEKIQQQRLKQAKRTGGKGLNILSGRALFVYDPSAFKDDQQAIDKFQQEEQQTQTKPIQFKQWNYKDIQQIEIKEQLNQYKVIQQQQQKQSLKLIQNIANQQQEDKKSN